MPDPSIVPFFRISFCLFSISGINRILNLRYSYSFLKMRGRNEVMEGKKVLMILCVAMLLVFSFIAYYGSFVTSRLISPGSTTIEERIWRWRLRINANPQDSSQETEENRDENNSSVLETGVKSMTSYSDEDEGVDEITVKSFPVCDSRYSELIPCLDRNLVSRLKTKPNYTLMEHYERHCPPSERRLNCLIPPPPNYKVPIRWPMSRDQVWQANVPHTFLASEKSDQRWMVVKGDKVLFPGGGTHFHDGADKYIATLGKMLNNSDGDLSGKGAIRTALDIGCGVASFGAYLLPNILAMSIAPNDGHENQIEFALERGIPATLGVLGTLRLPFPSQSYDFAHCSRCRIDWTQRDGILLLEVDRLLRPGGYYAWSSPPAYRDDEDDKKIWEAIDDLTKRMCWTIAAKEGQTVIWMKPFTNQCYKELNEGAMPPLCSEQDDPDAVWNVKMKACITPLSAYNDEKQGSGLLPWPKRLNTPPPRLQELNIKTSTFQRDAVAWRQRVELYWKQLRSQVERGSIRNIMDMNARLGGFAAALKDKPVWVMNVVPTSGLNTLKIIFDRGLIGTTHDWCESFSTYPRTFDLIHACDILSEIKTQGCSLQDLLLEMDRILRPMGIVIVRDKSAIIREVHKHLKALHWDAWSIEVDAEEDLLSQEDQQDTNILLARKQLWQPDESV